MYDDEQLVVSVVIGSYNRKKYLVRTIESARQELALVGHEIIVVDGGSTDGTMNWLVEQKDVITIIQHNRGSWNGKQTARRSWGYFMNLGFKVATGKYICMLSDDCLVIPGAITGGLHVAEKSRSIGGVAFYWRNWPEQQKYWVGKTFGDRLFVNHGLYRREALQEVGYADEENYHFYHADGDLALKIWEAGYQIVDSPLSYIEHHSHANPDVRASNFQRQKNDWDAYEKRWSALGQPQDDWVERDFFDESHTANAWRPVRAKRWMRNFRRALQKAIR